MADKLELRIGNSVITSGLVCAVGLKLGGSDFVHWPGPGRAVKLGPASGVAYKLVLQYLFMRFSHHHLIGVQVESILSRTQACICFACFGGASRFLGVFLEGPPELLAKWVLGVCRSLFGVVILPLGRNLGGKHEI
jgi:hypothetical protein